MRAYNHLTFSLEVLQSRLLKDNVVLTEYFYCKNHIYQCIVSDKDIELNQISMNPKNKNQIIDLINLFNEASAINNDISNYTEQAFNIYKLLKIDVLSSYKNVLIIPDGLLNFTPFEALLIQETNTTSFLKMPFVINLQKVLYNTNILFYLNSNQTYKKNRVLGFFPVFENTKQALTYSINEATALYNEMSAKLFMHNDATKSNFIKNANDYDVFTLFYTCQ